MKCTKCGYVSFDFLSECKQCGTNLAGTREALGFPAAKPAIPFYLGSLLKDYVQPSEQSDEQASAGGPSAFDFGEDESAKEDSVLKLDEVALSVPAAGTEIAMEHPDAPEEEFNLLDLSDEELDLLISDSQTETGDEKEQLSPGGPELEEALSLEGQKLDLESGVLELDFMLKAPGEESKSEPGGLGPRLDSKEMLSLSGADTQDLIILEEAGAKSEEDDALKIELSESELEDLLSELEGAPQKTDKKKEDK